jgi:hypothetical protein
MKMIVMDNFALSDPEKNKIGHSFIIENATLVPRIGERVNFSGYEPTPRVTDVA